MCVYVRTVFISEVGLLVHRIVLCLRVPATATQLLMVIEFSFLPVLHTQEFHFSVSFLKYLVLVSIK